jgi:hypothetical protein
MEYAEFEAEYRRVFELVVNGRGDTDLTPDIARLHALADRVADEDDRAEARSEVVGLENSLAHDDDEPPSEIIVEARAVFREADRNDGTTAERLARAEEGMQALMRIAANATPDERQAIGDLEHMLQMLIGALRVDMR